ncbi:CobQ/CobB/MinD/ParA nucleotide binding domain-containing protein [Rivularia sp. PCC 7116]|uniref:chromosome partitioning protein ParA n=1 Tax=Rivularia sp. PCC 7116 TaxID=373994 RepID=UPI00029EF007|nr:chromosome partitioning protein ParA [Rivularia sp. PCC 7116]AFY57321.1 CobQ/CobB/MinD/ParA nucleotide binding domain-containing protein [Rivularia sp. PCC 7116]
MSDTAENQQPEKRKRGRPKKNTNFSNASNNNSQGISITMQEKLQIAENSDAENGINPSGEASAQDWAKELEGDSNLPHTELLQSNTDEDKSEISSQHEPVTTAPISINTNNTASNQEKLVKIPTTIHIIDGEKGGAGKSFVSRALIEYCASIKHKVAIVDADKSNEDISQIYDNVHSAFFSDDDKKANQADHIFDLAFEKSVIVNLPAQVYSKVTDWIKTNDLDEIGKEYQITFVKWFVCTGGVDSVDFFIKSLNDLGDRVTHVFVKNLGLCSEWDYVDEMPDFLTAKETHKFKEMDFPKFPFWERNVIDRLGITFNSALSHPEIKVISRQRVKNFLAEVHTAFSETGLVK